MNTFWSMSTNVGRKVKYEPTFLKVDVKNATDNEASSYSWEFSVPNSSGPLF